MKIRNEMSADIPAFLEGDPSLQDGEKFVREALRVSAGSGDLEKVFLGVPAADGKNTHLRIYHRKLSGCLSREKQP